MKIGARVEDTQTRMKGIVLKIISTYRPYVFHIILLDSGEIVSRGALTPSARVVANIFGGWKNGFVFVRDLDINELLTHSNPHVRKIGQRRANKQQGVKSG